MKLKGCLVKIAIALVVLYLGICAFMFTNQQKFIFHENPLPKDFAFAFDSKFEELTIPSKDGTPISGLLFKAENPKGVVFYLHGNSGNLQGWSSIRDIYTSRGYDIFIMDYRGFGKSGGHIESQQQVYEDVQAAYDKIKARYPENKIIVAGYSIGTGPAAWLASKNHPKLLMLQAPYYNLLSMANHRFPFLPNFLLQFEFDTSSYVKNVSCPIWIFHGDKDQVIPVSNTHQLAKELKDRARVEIIAGQDHFMFNQNEAFQSFLTDILN